MAAKTVDENDIMSDSPDGDIETLPKKANIKAEKAAKKKANNGGRGKGGIIVLIIIVLLIGGAAAIVALDLFGLREQHIMPIVRGIPFVGSFFPAEESGAIVDTRTPEQLRMLYNSLELQNSTLEYQNATLQRQLEDANMAIANLRRFEEYFHAYRQATAEWNRMIAHGDPINFVEHFRYIVDEHVTQLWDEAMQINAFEDGIMEQVRTFNNMDADHTGAILERNLLLAPDLLVEWLLRMSASRRGEIFDTIDENIVATMMLLMTPTEPVFGPMTAPYLPLPPPVAGVIPDIDDEYEEESIIEEESTIEEEFATEEEYSTEIDEEIEESEVEVVAEEEAADE